MIPKIHLNPIQHQQNHILLQKSHPKMKQIMWTNYIQQGHHVFYELESPIRGASVDTLEGQGSSKRFFDTK